MNNYLIVETYTEGEIAFVIDRMSAAQKEEMLFLCLTCPHTDKMSSIILY
jgi:hypothetical protein